MKIGILTYHRAHNYGAVLQCHALMEALKGLGHTPVIINRFAKPSTLFTFLGKAKRILKGQPANQDPGWERFEKERKSILCPITKEFGSHADIINYDFTDFDAIIVGSDQIWRDDAKMIGNDFFLDFLPDSRVKRISYAASFGKDTWNDTAERTNAVKRLLQKFSSISVREESGRTICSNVFNVDSVVVLDPTMLHNSRIYTEQFHIDEHCFSKETVVTYFLGEEKEEQTQTMQKWSHNNGYDYKELYTLGYNDNCEYPKLHSTITEWVASIANAKYVVTNSFHAAVFSILFHKQFIVIDLKSGGSTRLHNLLSMVGLEERLVDSTNKVSTDIMDKGIDYKIVDEIIERNRKPSYDYLKKSLAK